LPDAPTLEFGAGWFGCIHAPALTLVRFGSRKESVRAIVPYGVIECKDYSNGLTKEVVMQMVGRVGMMGLGIALVGALTGMPVFGADAPIEDGSKIVITSPKDGDKVSDSFELKYELTKGSEAAHAHVYLDTQYQKGFPGSFKGLSKGKHQITVTGANKDHKLVSATQTITVEVQ
jgi:hypothetical protein